MRVGSVLLALVLAAQLRAQAPADPAGAGWVGVDGSLVTTVGLRPVLIVRTVAPGSPAEQAGLASGDTLIALDGTPPTLARFQELRTELRPGDRLELTVRRGPAARTMSVLAAPRPPDFRPPLVLRIDPARPPSLPYPTSIPGSGSGEIVRVPALADIDVPGEPSVGWVTPYLVGLDRVAGARMTPLNSGLSQYFGTDRGLLVIEVAPGTPAAAARFVAGDVVLQVGDIAVAEMQALRWAVATAPVDRPLPVVLLRRGRRLQLSLPR